ncbi:hypothetical protein HGI10_63020 [Streptomyces collinus]|nr:hypothetical protein HGI10_03920 [Streptomyces collinus]UJA12320.1 hypothetical protein HGI10_63020 [Streptomyces collinus]
MGGGPGKRDRLGRRRTAESSRDTTDSHPLLVDPGGDGGLLVAARVALPVPAGTGAWWGAARWVRRR